MKPRSFPFRSTRRHRCRGPRSRVRSARLAGFIEPATGSDLDADRTHLAVCSSTVTRIYRRDDVQKPDWKLISEVRYPAAQIEGICWNGRDLVLVAEGGAHLSHRREDLARRDAAAIQREAGPDEETGTSTE